MLLTAVIALAIALVALWHWGGAVRALLIAWLVCLTPTAIGVIDYDYLKFTGSTYVWVILGSVAAFIAGAAIVNAGHRGDVLPRLPDLAVDYTLWRKTAAFCLPIAAVSIVCTILNIATSGFNLSDLASVRADAVEMTSANIWARLAAITAWACFFCLGYGIYFRSLLGPGKTMLYLLAGSGIFTSMLALAGRNSVMQLIIYCLVIEGVRKSNLRKSGVLSTGMSMRIGVLIAGVAYLLYITLNRPGNLDAVDRSTVLFSLFNAHPSERLVKVLDLLPFIRGPAVEFIIYVTHTAPLFAISLQIDFGGPYYGMFTFPFIARQLEPLHGISVASVLDLKRFYVQSAGVIGFGWTTALSSFILDFGYIGCFMMLFVQGFLAQKLFWRVKQGGGIAYITLYAVMILNAALMPFIVAISDTNLLLLSIFICAMLLMRPERRPAAAG